MAMLDFPASPTVGQTYTVGNLTWVWDGAKWQMSATLSGPFLPISGGTLTGPLILAADPAVLMGAATKNYVDTQNVLQNNAVAALPVAMNDNRIINGAMSVDQRNNGGSVAVVGGYIIDRWNTWASTTGKATAGRALSAASDLAATGFGYCFRYTSLAAYTIPATETYGFGQPIEADLISDFAFGTPGAKPVTLSFWVYSNPVIGTFGGCLQSYATPYRSYPFTFSIPTAQTWTKISITIPGDTGGSAVWPINGTVGAMYVIFDMGSGSGQRGPANAWASATYNGANGTVNVFSAPNNFFITGVKLEIGSVATPFNQQTLSKIMLDCQRYFSNSTILWFGAYSNASQSFGQSIIFPARMRAPPTITFAGLTYVNASGIAIASGPSQGSVGIYANATAAGQAVFSANSAILTAEL
jgi:hypothetical protein